MRKTTEKPTSHNPFLIASRSRFLNYFLRIKKTSSTRVTRCTKIRQTSTCIFTKVSLK